jgi:hypothetical protein
MMSVQNVLARISEIQSAMAPAAPATTGGTQFQTALTQATAATPIAMAATATPIGLGAMQPAMGGTAGQRMIAAAAAEVGQAEQPPGSNDSARIGEYRTATAGSGVGPWCAYFTSWAAQQAGVPVGEAGQGFGSVDALYAWAQRTGRAIPAGNAPPQPGDLIVWDEHIGIVESVLPDGRIQTIEGNSSDQVARRSYGPDGGGALGYVRVG